MELDINSLSACIINNRKIDNFTWLQFQDNYIAFLPEKASIFAVCINKIYLMRLQ